MEKKALSQEELKRYARHLSLPDISISEQNKLKKAKVLVVGAGGLGSPLLLYLAAAGVGEIGIIDHDKVDASNLQRQILYTENDIDEPKAKQAANRVIAMNKWAKVKVYEEAFNIENARAIISEYDIIADGTDNFPTRYLVNDASVLEGKVNVYASVFRYEGQVSVFNFLKEDGERGPNYRDLFPEPPPPESVPNCAEGGVLGALVGIIGSMQATEVIKVITGVGEPLVGKLFIFDAATFSSQSLKFKKRKDIAIKHLTEYKAYCIPGEIEGNIDAATLKQWMENGEDFQLLDVRTEHERDLGNIGGEHIPLAELAKEAPALDKTKTTVVYCKMGVRSAQAIRILKAYHGFEALLNLKGGLSGYYLEK